MLLQFSVENYRSFKDRAVLSLEADSTKDLENNYIKVGKDKILKGSFIFGANAAGKSNIFKALNAAIMTVRGSNNRQVGEPLYFIVPFAFDEEYIRKPTKFEFVFITNGTKYVYGFEANRTQIFKEYLYAYFSNKATTIFERDETAKEKYKFTINSFKTKMKPLIERNTINKLFLATSASWNCEETRIPLMWFQSGINTFDQDFESLLERTGRMIESDVDGSLKKFMNNILHEADINICDYEYESKEFPSIPFNFLEDQSGTGEIRHKSYTIKAIHKVLDSNGNEANYKLDLRDESRGTQSLFFFSPFIKRAWLNGETLCIDEFDTGLHPLLVSYLVDLFNNPQVNKGDAQLIVSTHTTALLNLKKIRRDQIYFVEKNQETACSELYSLDEFSPRTREDINKEYMAGRFGSIPDLGDGNSLWL